MNITCPIISYSKLNRVHSPSKWANFSILNQFEPQRLLLVIFLLFKMQSNTTLNFDFFPKCRNRYHWSFRLWTRNFIFKSKASVSPLFQIMYLSIKSTNQLFTKSQAESLLWQLPLGFLVKRARKVFSSFSYYFHLFCLALLYISLSS